MNYLSKWGRKSVRLILVCVVFLTLTGCGVSDEDIYYYISDQTQMLADGGGSITEGMDLKETLYQKGVIVSDTVSAFAPIVIVISIFLGVMVNRLIKKEDRLRRDGMVLFLAVIPFITILFSYGLGAFLTWFHH